MPFGGQFWGASHTPPRGSPAELSRPSYWQPYPINNASPMTLLPPLSPFPSFSFTVLPGVTSQINYLNSNSCLIVCFGGDLSQNAVSLYFSPPLTSPLHPSPPGISRSEKPQYPVISSSILLMGKQCQLVPNPPWLMAQMPRVSPIGCKSAHCPQ